MHSSTNMLRCLPKVKHFMGLPKFASALAGLPFPTIHCEGNMPGVVFCHGLGSAWDAPKPLGLQEHLTKRGNAYSRFQYRFVGDEKAIWHIDTWVEDILTVMDHLDSVYGQPQIYIAASAGGVALLRAALLRPKSVRSLLLMAPGVGIDLSYMETISPGSIARLNCGDVVTHPGLRPELDCKVNMECLQSYLDTDPLRIAVNSRKRIPLNCPIKIIHGMQDILVPYTNSLRLAEHVASKQVEIILLKNEEHVFALNDNIMHALDQLIDNVSYDEEDVEETERQKKTYLRMVQ